MPQKELKATLFRVLLDDLEPLHKHLIWEDNDYVVTTLARQRKWRSPELLAHAIKPGAGKNFFMNVFMRYVLNPCMTVVINDIDRLAGRFNSLFVGKTLVLIDEAIDTANRKGN
ncbi:uncharacterized protein KRP23_130 [Phytophthora ramorum]|uniref:uncharacterized protein n=1 Tax=Phytophthora ramorum TaxID=164328 RepID=UPI0030ADA332|nr:hypothetical protein KRP23_129 [Phytophthora ramorum]KAH7491205.1 hypothetical protein KRP23_130 [Phytophthora ramorum]